MQSKDGHAIWVSRATLNANTPYPDSVDGGVILRDENGQPAGTSEVETFIALESNVIVRVVFGQRPDTNSPQ